MTQPKSWTKRRRHGRKYLAREHSSGFPAVEIRDGVGKLVGIIERIATEQRAKSQAKPFITDAVIEWALDNARMYGRDGYWRTAEHECEPVVEGSPFCRRCGLLLKGAA